MPTWGGALRLFVWLWHALGGAPGRPLCLVTLLDCLSGLFEQHQLHRAYELRQKHGLMYKALQGVISAGGAAFALLHLSPGMHVAGSTLHQCSAMVWSRRSASSLQAHTTLLQAVS